MKKTFYWVGVALISLFLSPLENIVAMEVDDRSSCFPQELIKKGSEVWTDFLQLGSRFEQVCKMYSCDNNEDDPANAALPYSKKPVHEIGVDLLSQWK